MGEVAAGSEVTCELSIRIGGRTVAVEHRPGTTILQSARMAGLRPNSSCEMGNCATCMARLVEGTADMRTNDALDDDDLAEGLILTCQAEPTSATALVDYEY